MVEYVVLLERITALVNVRNLNIFIVGIDLAATLIYGAEHRFDTRRSLRHQRGGARRCDRKHSHVTTTVFNHHLVEFGISLLDTLDHRVACLLLRVIHRELAALRSHNDRCAISRRCQRALNIHCEVDSLLRTVGQTQSGQHIALGGDTQTSTTTLQCLFADLLPQLQLHSTNVLVLGVACDLRDDGLDLLQLQVDDVVHHTHCLIDVRLEQVEIELSLSREGVLNVAIKVDSQQSAAIVGAQRNLAAGVGRNRYEALVSVAVGHTLADHRIPEQNARLSRLPRIVDNLVPQRLCIYVLFVKRFFGVDRELLAVGFAFQCAAHKLVVDLDRDVCARNLTQVGLSVDKTLSVGVFDREREHQCATATVLSHLAGRVRVALHKRNNTGRGQCAVQYGATRGTQVREVVAHATATFHQLYLLLVDTDNTAIRVSGVLVADYEAVRQRCNLERVADTGHRAALRNDVAEVVEQLEYLGSRHRVSVAIFDTGDLVSDAPMHLLGRALVDVAE